MYQPNLREEREIEDHCTFKPQIKSKKDRSRSPLEYAKDMEIFNKKKREKIEKMRQDVIK